MDFEKISDWIARHENEMVELQKELTARPAIAPDSGGVGEWAKACFLEDYLCAHGFDDVAHFDCPDERMPEGTRPNFVVTVPGENPKPCIWVLCHMDVVPPGEKLPDGSWKGWDSDPYKVQRVGDMLVGRGVSDDQQAIVSTVFAARALRENNVQPAQTLKLLFVSDEETNSTYGLRHVVNNYGDLFSPQDAFLVPDGGSVDSSMIEIAEKSMLWLEFRVTGKQAHGSRPDIGVNAFRAASRLVYLLDTGLSKQFDRVDHLYEPPYSTFEPTKHEANVPNVNTIPGEDVFCFDCRVLPHYNLDDIIGQVESECRQIDKRQGTRTEVKTLRRMDAPLPTQPDAPVVRLLKPAIEKVYNVKPRTMGIGGATVASPLRERGLAAAVWMSCSGTAHQVNELCSIAQMIGDTKVFAHVFMSEF